jgi:hypothetical protein
MNLWNLMRTGIPTLMLVFSFILNLHNTTAQNRYVDSARSSSGNGKSWSTAFKTLTEALDSAWVDTTIEKIFVAKGTYFPGNKPYDMGSNRKGTVLSTSDNKDKTFHIRAGLEVYGGYQASSGNRNIAANPTVLSGVLGGTDSAYHVVIMNYTNNWQKSNDTLVLEGFTVMNGRATGSGIISINGRTFNKFDGGGICIDIARVILRNNTVVRNKASQYGGGLCIIGSTGIVSNNLFAFNRASGGGGVYESSWAGTFLSNTVRDNHATSGGGIKTMFSDGGKYVNNLISQNTSIYGGGVYSYDATSLNFINNTITGNKASGGTGGGIYTDDGNNGFLNTIIWGNSLNNSKTLQGADYYSSNNSNNTFRYCMLQLKSDKYTTAWGGTYDLGYTARGNIFGIDPLFKGGSDIDSLSPGDCSPALDAGNDSLLFIKVDVDFLGNTRKHNVPYAPNYGNSYLDIGAFESTSTSSSNPITPTLSSLTSSPSEIVGGGVFTNKAKGSHYANWYDAAIGGKLVWFHDTMFKTPLINSTTTYYAAGVTGICISSTRISVRDSVSPCPGYTILYVDSSKSVSGNGSSWSLAFKTVDEALELAWVCPDIKKIFVAKGTYIPGKKPYAMYGNKIGIELVTSDKEDMTFHLRPGLQMYGGYNASSGIRDIKANQTVLSGLLGGLDTSCHVVLINYSSHWGNTKDTTMLDGFTVMHGSANNQGMLPIATPGVQQYKGGGIHIINATASVSNSRIMANSGSGIYALLSRVTLSSNTISSNTSDIGGGIDLYESRANINDNLLENNDVTWKGGAIYTEQTFSIITGNIIRNNAARNGAGMFSYWDSIAMHNNMISGNLADFNFGGLAFDRGMLSFTGNKVLNNISDNICGGLYINDCVSKVHHNLISGNGAPWAMAGGVYLSDGYNQFHSNTVCWNYARNGGGIYTNYDAVNNISNNTIAYNSTNDNLAITNGGGLLADRSTDTISNNIFWGNTFNKSSKKAGADYYSSNIGNKIFRGNMLQMSKTGFVFSNNGNYAVGLNAKDNIFGVDPLFKGGSNADSLSLKDCSPALDAGLNSLSPKSVSVDILGNSRKYDVPYVANNDTNYIDIGAYENQSMLTSNPISPTLGTLSSTPKFIYGSGVFVNKSSGHSHSVNWYNVPSGGSPLLVNDSIFVTPVLTANKKYYASAAYGSCISAGRISVLDSVIPCGTFNVLYVDSAAAVGGTGGSWTQAFRSLSEAMTAAWNCPNVTRINVAKGTYAPERKPYNMIAGKKGAEISTTDNNDKTFHVRPGLDLYGGYNAATGIRDINANRTVLNGVLGNKDTAYHVVMFLYTSTWGNASDTGILDGFTVMNGRAKGTQVLVVEGYGVPQTQGAGVFVHTGINVIRNSTIMNNRAHQGGGVFSFFSYTRFANSRIINNSATQIGGGFYIEQGAAMVSENVISGNEGGGVFLDAGSTVIARNRIFKNNANFGGGIYINSGTFNISNNLIFSNTSDTKGGGIMVYGGTVNLINNTIYANISGQGGGLYTIGGTTNVSNCIFRKNRHSDPTILLGAEYYHEGGNNTFSHNVMQYPSYSYGLNNSGPHAIGAGAKGNLYGIDPLLVGGNGHDSLALADCSPAIDKGNDTLLPSSSIMDILGNGRRHDVPYAANFNGAALDIGSYENQSSGTSNPVNPIVTSVTSEPAYRYAAGVFVNKIVGATHKADWYNQPSGGSAIISGQTTYATPILNASMTYYVAAAHGACVSSTRIPVRDSVIPCPSFTTLYVNGSATKGGDGSSWSQAFKTLDQAIIASWSCPNIQKILVAKGTYIPSTKPILTDDNKICSEVATYDQRDKCFHLRKGIELYGGYNALTGVRDVDMNTTTLSGNLGGGKSVYHVLIVDNSYVWISTVDTTVIEGFSISDGNADKDSALSVSNWYYHMKYGGGIYVSYQVVAIRNNRIASNKGGQGGGISMISATGIISGNSFHNNVASSFGSSIYSYAGWNLIEDNKISGNSAHGGGGIYITSGISSIRKNTIESNNATNTGGGLMLSGGVNTVENNSFLKNYGSNAGGAIYMSGGQNVINGNTIHGNISNYAGGGIFTASGSNYVVNNVIARNKASIGAGMMLASSQDSIINNTVIFNDASSEAGAVYCDQGSHILSNNIFAYNTANKQNNSPGADYYLDIKGGNMVFRNNLMQLDSVKYKSPNSNPLMTGSGNNLFARDPKLRDTANATGPDNKYRTGDDGYRLNFNSPCINRGDNSFMNAGISADIRYYTRISNGTIDLGAYEYDRDVSVNPQITPDIQIYPNPSSGLYTIDGPLTGMDITVYDLTGRPVLMCTATGTTNINLTDHANGIYVVVIDTAVGRYVVKIVKDN